MIKVFDALKNELNEINGKDVTMYVCGPTVYDHPHIGNMRPMLTFDVLYRLLKVQGFNVKYVHNITDIDDKIIKRAGELNITEKTLTEIYTKEYLTLMEQFNAYFPNIHKVSEEIDDIIAFINQLIQNKHAYIEDGSVYFDVLSDKYYGELSHNDTNKLLESVRIENNDNKHNPLDFALWKKTNIGLNWPTPWSIGRPGWHTECVEMCNKYLGKQITIHGGGVDLKFPHHENENAQNRGVNKVVLAQNFMYVGQLTINNKKMSKSLGNIILAIDFIQKYSSNQIRWFFYQKHYASPIDYSENTINDACLQINKLENTLNAFKTKYYAFFHVLVPYKETYNENFLNYLNNDLNFANATDWIMNQAKKLSVVINKQNGNELLKIYFDILGALKIYAIKFPNKHNTKILQEIDAWIKLLKSKQYQKADQKREFLMQEKLL